MNAEPLAKGFAGVLKSLNGDRAYGLALLGACAVLLLSESTGEAGRRALSYDRAALGAGEWWRVLTAHFVHLDWRHALLNMLGLVLLWALFARDYSPLRWAAIYSFAAGGVSAGLWLFNPEVQWYVGASGALHGVMTAGTLTHLRRREFDGWILAVFILAKLGYEQWSGALPFAGTAATIVDAHLYGAAAGLALALVLRPRAQPL